MPRRVISEAQKQASRRYVERNKEYIKVRSSEYYQANADTIRARRRQRYREQKERERQLSSEHIE